MIAAVKPQTQIRPMLPSDLRVVASVERASYDYPWSRGIFRDCLLAGYGSLVLDIDGAVTGHAIMSVAAGEAHILNICVHPDVQRMGYGRRLLHAVLVKAEEAEAKKIFLEVRPSNTVALQLYRSVGFEEIGVRPAYYQAPNGREDAVVLASSLPSTSS